MMDCLLTWALCWPRGRSIRSFASRRGERCRHSLFAEGQASMKLSRLFVYPVKSCAGIELTEATVDQFGITNDRRWLIVDTDGVALTQRDHPRMALLRP